MTRVFAESVGKLVSHIDDYCEYDFGVFLRLLEDVADVLTAQAREKSDIGRRGRNGIEYRLYGEDL